MKKLLILLLVITTLIPLAAQDLQNISDRFAELAEKVSPSVVTVTAQKVTKIKNPFGDLEIPFDFFGFNLPEKEREFRSSALGSGVIVENGYVVTNNHVIENAEEIKIVLHDKREFDAEVAGTDPKTDIAILKIDDKRLPNANLGNSDELRVGEWVLAIGSPFSTRLGNTVTHGIVSGLGRSGMQLSSIENYIQTDASINPGNSGGALVNMNGEVIGINSAILSRSGGSNGIGFAIPINLANRVLQDIITKGRVVRAWLGVTIQELNQDLSRSLGLEEVSGVLISDIVKNSPAEKADLKSGDVVIKVDHEKINTPSELQLNISSRMPGENIKLTIIRDGKTRIVSVDLEELPEDEPVTAERNGRDIDLGFTVRENSAELARQFKLDSQEGVVIVSVDPGSEIQQKGVRPGDRLISVERKEIRNMKDFDEILEDIEKDQTVLILVETRNGNKRFITVQVK
ncbi:MAG: DegQ family serine endoprotease [Fidelibacterota bacterium]